MVHLGKISEVQTIGLQTPQKHYENQWQICAHFPEGTPLPGAAEQVQGAACELAAFFSSLLFFFPFPPPLLPIWILLVAFQQGLEMGWGRFGLGKAGGAEREGLRELERWFSISFLNILIPLIDLSHSYGYFHP